MARERFSFDDTLEFDKDEFKMSDLKKILAGESLKANVKGKSPVKIQIKLPIIIVSNFEAPSLRDSVKYKGFEERVKIVHADQLIR